MIFNILHLNVEKGKHVNSVFNLLKEKKPDFVCLEEVRDKDVKFFSSELNYFQVFSPTDTIIEKNGEKYEEGSAILSKNQILDTQVHRYDDKILDKPPVEKIEDNHSKNGIRPPERFLEERFLLTISVKLGVENNITISTTHFPVTDHTSPGKEDHVVNSFQNIDDVEHSDILMDRLIKIVRSIKGPLVFTADLNNERKDYLYNELAHELIDRVPRSLDSSIDPNLHRVKNLKLVVDTVMTTPDISVKSFEVIEGISDHKAYFVTLEI